MQTRFISKKCLVIVLTLAMAGVISATEVFTLNLTIPDALITDLACGMDGTAYDDYDSLDETYPPFDPGGAKLAVYFYNALSFPTNLTKDIRASANEKTWQLNVYNMAANSTFRINWTSSIGAPNIFIGANHPSLHFKKPDTTDITLIPVGATENGSGFIDITENGNYSIILRTGDNAQPSAVNDYAVALKDQPPITINVLANDSDPDKDALIISTADATSANSGTVAIAGDNKSLTYTPPANYVGTYPFEDTFNYTISDQFAGTGGPGTSIGIVTVQVSEGAVATRSHDVLATTGSNFTITLNVVHNGTLTNLKIEEFLPIADNVANPWTYKAGSVSLANVTPTQAANKITFDFTVIPASPFTMTYQVVVPTTEGIGTTKDFDGTVYVNNSATPASNIPKTSLVVGLPYHSADYTNENGDGGADWKIDIGELQRVLFLYNNGGYYAPAVGAPDGFNRSDTQPVATTGHHSADYTNENGDGGPDWKIDIGELQRVLFLYNNGGYYAPDVNGPDGYNRSVSPPTR